MDRALVSGTKGRGFESRQARFSPLWNFEESYPLPPILPPEVVQNLRKFLWPVSPCSYRSRCSRFKFLNRSVRCNSNRESLYGLFFLVRTVSVVRGSWNSTGVSPGGLLFLRGVGGRCGSIRGGEGEGVPQLFTFHPLRRKATLSSSPFRLRLWACHRSSVSRKASMASSSVRKVRTLSSPFSFTGAW